MQLFDSFPSCLTISFGFLLALGLTLDSIGTTIAEPTGPVYSYVEYEFNKTKASRAFTGTNVKGLVRMLNQSVSSIQTKLDAEMESLQPLLNTLHIMKRDGFLFTFKTVQDMINQFESQKTFVTTKLELSELEFKARESAQSLIEDEAAGDERTWLEERGKEISEGANKLYAHFKELTHFHEMHSSFLPMLMTRMAVSALDNSTKHCEPRRQFCPKFNSWFTCDDGQKALPCVKFCNGHPECNDKSDEPPNCTNSFYGECPPSQFRCDDKVCLSLDECLKTLPCRDLTHREFCEANKMYWAPF